MARHASDEERAKVKMQAAFAGVDIDKEEKKRKEKEQMLFRDPADYEQMSSEEREELTKKMMGKFKGFFSKGPVKAG